MGEEGVDGGGVLAPEHEHPRVITTRATESVVRIGARTLSRHAGLGMQVSPDR